MFLNPETGNLINEDVNHIFIIFFPICADNVIVFNFFQIIRITKVYCQSIIFQGNSNPVINKLLEIFGLKTSLLAKTCCNKCYKQYG